MPPATPPTSLDRSVRLLAPLIDALPVEDVLVWDETGTCTPTTAGQRAAGTARGLAGRSLAELEAGGNPAAAAAAALRTALAGEAGELEWSPGGGSATHRLRCLPLREAERVVGVGALLERLPEADDPGALASRLERCEHDLQHFAYVTSHDLSEPLRIMSGYAEMLERRYEDQLDDRGRRYLASIVAGAGHLHELLEALLAYSRARSQPIRFEQIDLDEVLATVRGELAGPLAERAVELTSEPLPTVSGDAPRIVAVLAELVVNAIKFSADAPRVHVAARDTGAMWEISIRDQGIGIDPAQQDRVFELLQRLHSRDDHPGVGAGLTVARETARAHGGDLRVESGAGAGSVFVLTLPKPSPETARAPR